MNGGNNGVNTTPACHSKKKDEKSVKSGKKILIECDRDNGRREEIHRSEQTKLHYTIYTCRHSFVRSHATQFSNETFFFCICSL